MQPQQQRDEIECSDVVLKLELSLEADFLRPWSCFCPKLLLLSSHKYRLPAILLDHLQSMLSAEAWQIASLKFKLAVIVYHALRRISPQYLCDQLVYSHCPCIWLPIPLLTGPDVE